MNDEEVTTA